MSKFIDLSYYRKTNHEIPLIFFPIRERQLYSNSINVFSTMRNTCESDYSKKILNYFFEKDDLLLIDEEIKTHGHFFPKFFRVKIREKIRTKISQNSDSQLIKDFVKFKNNYSNEISLNRNVINDLSHDYLNVLYYNHINENLFSTIEDIYRKKSVNRNCPICREKFNSGYFPDWIYYGSNGNDSICYECLIIKSPIKKDLEKNIQALISICGFIPNADLNPINYNFSSRVKNEDWIKVCEIIFKMGFSANQFSSTNPIITKKFGSWLKALISAGVLEDNVLKSGRGFRCIAKSGNECNSLDEQYIDNWLFDVGYKTVKEPHYPKHTLYNPSGKRRADWSIGDVYVEYFGLKGDLKYDQKTYEKIKLAEDCNIHLISIYPEDLGNLKIIFENLST